MIQQDTRVFQEIAEAVARRVVVARASAEAGFIRLPICYPGGSTVVAHISIATSFRR